ncbi:branched-chain amino acid ABC transporter permease LivH [Bartonella sp. HY329]|uniref:branched-chain amino acid ABC transporter permease n=1 Tax=unclassified Bartonella TaxID=2645622 RepID=UPI0021C5739A|nr:MULTISPECIES: branched-chain amino acid ABC transporter permease LivH [unclassified Bartonella]UXM94805.1 branched-chain amino acid ABC transporter permease LivH [Bartonella sp. HY329]UXN09128.1 branched-chain amino acid ABC transporter permease LivH [Bartonella sp. HY328]
MDYDLFFQVLINGLALGAIYGLIAIGYTMVYGILGMINFSHGDVFMVSAFIALIAFMLFALLPTAVPILLALILIMIIGVIFTSAWSWTIERVAYRPLRGSFRLAPLITAIGMSIVLKNFVPVFQGQRPKSLQDVISGGILIPGTNVTLQFKQIMVFATTIILLAVFTYIVTKTSIGRAQRACAQDAKMASLLGINVDRTISMTFIMGGALAAVAGAIFLSYYNYVSAADGFIPGIKAFTAAVLGGIGSLNGAVLGGILIALVEVFWAAYVNPAYKDVAAFSVLIIVLIFMPTGLLGRADVEKV